MREDFFSSRQFFEKRERLPDQNGIIVVFGKFGRFIFGYEFFYQRGNTAVFLKIRGQKMIQ